MLGRAGARAGLSGGGRRLCPSSVPKARVEEIRIGPLIASNRRQIPYQVNKASMI